MASSWEKTERASCMVTPRIVIEDTRVTSKSGGGKSKALPTRLIIISRDFACLSPAGVILGDPCRHPLDFLAERVPHRSSNYQIRIVCIFQHYVSRVKRMEI